MKTDSQANPPAYQVTPLDNFDWYEGAGVPTPCRDAEHALSVAKGILERSLAHEHNQAKDPASAEELFSRWDDFGDFPSIFPKLDPPFEPSEYARQRAAEICRAHQASEAHIDPVEMNDRQNARQFANETRACAMQMMENAAFIQKELPPIEMPDSLRSQIESLCALLIETKHDLIQEIIEAVEWLESDPSKLDLWKECIRPWILDVMMSINECIEAVQAAVKDGAASPLVSLLVTESAANILNAVPAFPPISEDNDSEPDDTEEEDENEQDADDSDPNCYAFYSEDSYPVRILIAAIRRLIARPHLSAETTENLKVFLFAMERLPLVTPGVRMSLGLRLDQGGESDWIEIRMEDGEFSLGRGTWVDGDADTETVFEVTPDYRDGDAFIASQFAQSFIECARDVCREVVIEDFSDEPFTRWDLKPDKKRWGSLPCSFL